MLLDPWMSPFKTYALVKWHDSSLIDCGKGEIIVGPKIGGGGPLSPLL